LPKLFVEEDFFPRFQDEFALRVNKDLRLFEEMLSGHALGQHSWNQKEAVTLQNEIKNVKSTFEMNQILYLDHCQDIQAIQSYLIKRSYNLMVPITSLHNEVNFLAAATLCRSLLELSIWSLWHSTTIKKMSESVTKELAETGILIVKGGGGSPLELADLLQKLLHGTRLKDIKKLDPDWKQMHIMDELKKFGKYDTNKYVEELYDFLCELTHPNIIGNEIFLHVGENERHVITPHQTGWAALATIEKICACLSWSAQSMVNADENFDEAILQISNALDLNYVSVS